MQNLNFFVYFVFDYLTFEVIQSVLLWISDSSLNFLDHSAPPLDQLSNDNCLLPKIYVNSFKNASEHNILTHYIWSCPFFRLSWLKRRYWLYTISSNWNRFVMVNHSRTWTRRCTYGRCRCNIFYKLRFHIFNDIFHRVCTGHKAVTRRYGKPLKESRVRNL